MVFQVLQLSEMQLREIHHRAPSAVEEAILDRLSEVINQLAEFKKAVDENTRKIDRIVNFKRQCLFNPIQTQSSQPPHPLKECLGHR